ncbi:MAG TPA: aspartyl protease family protein [Hyphomonadaceae bacterium]|nr:aspartyl protease family protein [Hyphomonadaceae bacterium]
MFRPAHSRFEVSRRTLLAAAPAFAVTGVASAQQTGTRIQTPAEAEQQFYADLPLDAWTDAYGRPTARVMIDGFGPFRFLVDTGSTTTVIAARHAAAMKTPIIGLATVNGTTGAAEMPVAHVSRLETGVVDRENFRVAVLSDMGLAREDGILGADVFAGRRLSFDIQSKSVRVEGSQRQTRVALKSNMRVRNGLLAEIDGRVGTIPVRLMLDTGAQHCIANIPLQRAIERTYPKQPRVNRIRVVGVTGHVIVGDFFELPKVDFRKFVVKDAGAVAADAPIFKLWGLDTDPAMIVGVNLLSRLASFSIDYGARVFDAELMAAAIANGDLRLG